MRRRHVLLIFAALLPISLATPARAGLIVDPIVTGPEYQVFGSANDTYMAWTQNTTTRQRAFDALASVREDPSSPTQLNAGPTRGFVGGFDPGTNTVIYQQIAADGDRSDIFGYNLDTDVRTAMGVPVNSDHWEYQPRVSTSFVTFIRVMRSEDRLLLWDRSGESLVQIDAATFRKEGITNGTVGERYVTWTRCTRRSCFAMYYDTQTTTTHRVPPVDNKVQYAPTIDETTGELFWVRSGFRCGRGVRIFRAPLDDVSAAVAIAVLPDGVDTDATQYLVPDPNTKGSIDLWFGRYDCSQGDQDVYALRGATTVARVAPTGHRSGPSTSVTPKPGWRASIGRAGAS